MHNERVARAGEVRICVIGYMFKMRFEIGEKCEKLQNTGYALHGIKSEIMGLANAVASGSWHVPWWWHFLSEITGFCNFSWLVLVLGDYGTRRVESNAIIQGNVPSLRGVYN